MMSNNIENERGRLDHASLDLKPSLRGLVRLRHRKLNQSVDYLVRDMSTTTLTSRYVERQRFKAVDMDISPVSCEFA